MKKTRRRSTQRRLEGPWMNILAFFAAESRLDGGAGLQLLAQHAKFDVRPRLSLQKHTAAERAGALSHKAA